MKMWIAVFVAAFVAGAAAQCPCPTMKWAVCDGPPCQCTLQLSESLPQSLGDCKNLVSKCYLMKAEMYRARTGQSTRSIGGKPVETAFVDNDGIYDPECENDGKFKAKQCNNTAECWCVNSAGVRRTDKGDKNMKCEELVETYWVRLQLTHKPVANPVNADNLNVSIVNAMKKRYLNDYSSLVKNIQYDPKARMIVVDVQKPLKNRDIDLPTMAYYMEKDVKVLPLFSDEGNFTVNVDGQSLQMENILVYYVDEQPPTFTMKHLSGGIIAVIVVVVLAVVIGLLVLFFTRKRLSKKYNKAQQRELEPM